MFCVLRAEAFAHDVLRETVGRLHRAFVELPDRGGVDVPTTLPVARPVGAEHMRLGAHVRRGDGGDGRGIRAVGPVIAALQADGLTARVQGVTPGNRPSLSRAVTDTVLVNRSPARLNPFAVASSTSPVALAEGSTVATRETVKSNAA